MKQQVTQTTTKDTLDDALAELHAAEANAATASAALATVNDAVGRAQAQIAKHTDAAARLDKLRQARTRLMAAHFLGKGDDAALAASATAIAALEASVRELEPLAHDAVGALSELQARYADAAAPVRVANSETAACHYKVMLEAAEVLLESYGAQVEGVLDLYAELVVLAGQINQIAKPAGLPLVYPEIPQQFEFPAIVLGRWKMTNTAGVPHTAIEAARLRLDEKLQALGVV